MIDFCSFSPYEIAEQSLANESKIKEYIGHYPFGSDFAVYFHTPARHVFQSLSDPFCVEDKIQDIPCFSDIFFIRNKLNNEIA